MNEMKAYIESLLQFTGKKLGTIVYIGAGSGAQVTQLCELKPQSFTAVEASKELFKSLQRKAKKYDYVRLLNGWVLPSTATEAAAYFYNNPRYNALIKLDDKAYENLKVVREEKVKGTSISTLLSKELISLEQLNILILDVSGAEQFFLEENHIQEFNQFDYVFLSSKEVTNFVALNEIGCLSGFVQIPTLFEKESNLTILMRNQAFQETQNELLLERARYKELQLIVEAEKEARTQTGLDLDELKTDMQLASNKVQELVEKLSTNEAERKALIVKQEELESSNKELRTQRDNHERHHKENKEWAEALSIANTKLKGELEEVKANLEAEVNRLNTLKTKCESLEEANKYARQRYERVENVADMNAKLLTKSQVDLDELRAQLKAKNERVEELTMLISSLHDKLAQASSLYFELQRQHPELGLEQL